MNVRLYWLRSLRPLCDIFRSVAATGLAESVCTRNAVVRVGVVFISLDPSVYVS
jgi:hypothetical protein